ncbi:MAG: nucleotidyl transferase AbiEii/AbiGii toxin family protein [Treponemataceae bacterium]
MIPFVILFLCGPIEELKCLLCGECVIFWVKITCASDDVLLKARWLFIDKFGVIAQMLSVDRKSGIMLFAESLEEILADKIIAFALRPNRVKNRDLWDIDWMTRRGISLKPDLITKKIADRQIESEKFHLLFAERISTVENGQSDFLFELKRFLPAASVQQGIERKEYWMYLISVLREAERKTQFQFLAHTKVQRRNREKK